MTYNPVLFFHCADKSNTNAQSNNTKAILARWSCEDLPAAVFHFDTPDPAVAANPNVRLIKLPANRLWKVRAFLVGLGKFAGVYYPGLAPTFDNRILGIRRQLGLGGAVITSLEGVPVNESQQSAEEQRLSTFAGHQVRGQSLKPEVMQALIGVKGYADQIIAISPFLQRMASHLWPGIPTSCIPLGVNLRCFNASGRVPHGTNQRLRVICAGSFQFHKRPEFFLELARRYPQADFIWYGDGAMRAPLLDRVRSERLQNVSFPGSVNAEALAEAFRAADIFSMPSVAEGVPKVTQEAAACGLPVVCMHYYEPFSVIDGVNGYQATDDAAYFSHMDELINDPSLRKRMGAASAEMAKDWNWDQLAVRWQEAIRDVVFQKAGQA
ncbi:glycosyltransferase [uncultured Marinobacter sp.]|uniref:glycosyltransferase family 4 protein n=1 Tax=uncultured Marinobacter sp. TaxID=187379 RepID=UPI002612A804|nr:glycosyltransferase [uncultured Marinobacter sp.]